MGFKNGIEAHYYFSLLSSQSKNVRIEDLGEIYLRSRLIKLNCPGFYGPVKNVTDIAKFRTLKVEVLSCFHNFTGLLS